MKIYNALTLPITLYGRDIWTLRKELKKRFTSVEMKFFRRAARYNLFDRKKERKNFGRVESRAS